MFAIKLIGYADASAIGLGIVAIVGSLTVVSIGISTCAYLMRKRSPEHCNDVILVACIAFVVGNVIPGLGLVDLLRRGMGPDGDVPGFLWPGILAGALVINSTISILAVCSALSQKRRMRSEGHR